MIFYVLLGLTGLWIAYRLQDKFGEASTTMLRLLLVLPCLWVGWLVLFGVHAQPGHVTHGDRRAELLALRDGVRQEGSLDGSFVLVVGAVGGSSGPTWRYTWYERGAGGAVRLRTVRADGDGAAIYEDAPERPHVIERLEGVEHPVPGWVAPFDGFTRELETVGWDLHVPPGTVERAMRLDLR